MVKEWAWDGETLQASVHGDSMLDGLALQYGTVHMFFKIDEYNRPVILLRSSCCAAAIEVGSYCDQDSDKSARRDIRCELCNGAVALDGTAQQFVTTLDPLVVEKWLVASNAALNALELSVASSFLLAELEAMFGEARFDAWDRG